MYYRNASGVLTRIPVGSDNHVLTLDGAVPGWEAASVSGAQTNITTILNASTKIGRDSHNLIDFATTDNKIIMRVSDEDEVELVQNAFSPVTSDGVALGTTSLMWSDLFLANESVINFNNGDMTLTHSSNTVTVAGGTFATAALTATTGTFTGVLKTQDTTEATTTTDGSLQTDGGLSVVGDCVFGDDVKLLSDSAILSFGANSEITLTHEHNVGLILEGNGVTACPVLTLKNTNNDATGSSLKFLKDGSSVANNDVIGNITFVSEDDGDNVHTYASIVGSIADMAGGAEGGKLSFNVAEHDGGAPIAGLEIIDGDADGELDVNIGAGANSLTTIAGDLDIPNGSLTVGSDASGDMYYRNASGVVT